MLDEDIQHHINLEAIRGLRADKMMNEEVEEFLEILDAEKKNKKIE